MNRVPVVSCNNKPLMPTKSSRARRWVKEGKAVGKWSDVGIEEGDSRDSVEQAIND